jgi:hypothetical protein
MQQPMMAVVRTASDQARHDRVRARQALDEIFRAGTPPDSRLAGRLAGRLVLLDVAPVVTALAAGLASAWMPWKGKTFDPARGCGDNVFERSSLPLARLLWPFYRGIRVEGPQTYRAFEFRTCLAPGLFDPDRTVLKIDYDTAANPGLSIRRVLDELVQIADDLYLGKAHLKWWWGRWQTVAYFSLEGKA